METIKFAHIDNNGTIYVVEQSKICNWFDDMIEKGINLSNSFLIKISE